jgi:hypothetical protein
MDEVVNRLDLIRHILTKSTAAATAREAAQATDHNPTPTHTRLNELGPDLTKTASACDSPNPAN